VVSRSTARHNFRNNYQLLPSRHVYLFREAEGGGKTGHGHEVMFALRLLRFLGGDFWAYAKKQAGKDSKEEAVLGGD
jgi:hypothetical protein